MASSPKTENRLPQTNASSSQKNALPDAGNSAEPEIPLIEEIPIWEELYFPLQNPPNIPQPHLEDFASEESVQAASEQPEEQPDFSSTEDTSISEQKPSFFSQWQQSLKKIDPESQRSLLLVFGLLIFIFVIGFIRARGSFRKF